MKFAIFSNVPESIGRVEVKNEAEKRGHKIDFISINTVGIDRESIENIAAPFLDYDVVHIAGGLGEHITLAVNNFLQSKGVFCINGRIIPGAGSKIAQGIKLSESGVPTPKTFMSRKADFATLQTLLKVPFVAKDPKGAHGSAVYLIKTEEDISALIIGREYLYQEFIENDGDYRVHVLGGKTTFCSYKRESGSEDFRSNISLGGVAKMVEGQETISWVEKLAIDAASALNLDYCGVDIIRSKTDGAYYVIETNLDPGFKYVKEVTGQSFAVPIVDYYESLGK